MHSRNANEHDVLRLLQDWYRCECNGDWEHQYGVVVQTVDNPGWSVTIDLAETAWADVVVARTPHEFDETDPNWFQYEIKEGKFRGGCGPSRLPELLSKFFELIGYGRQISD
jgi:hypothetical protein